MSRWQVVQSTARRKLEDIYPSACSLADILLYKRRSLEHRYSYRRPGCSSLSQVGSDSEDPILAALGGNDIC
jgi:hypothetical protein